MASPVVFKLNVINPNLKDTPSKNKSNIYYIGKRLGVSLNEGMTHGLFGKVGDEDFGNIKSIKEVADYVYEKSKEKTIMYRAVISLKEEDALRLGYDSRETWEQLMKENIFEIADKIGIPSSRVEYVSAVHMDKGHPHLHFTLWDKEQGVKEAKVHWRILNQIRINLTKKVFKDELNELYQLKNEARDILTESSDKFFKDFFEPFKDMSEKEYKNTMEDIKNDTDNFFGSLVNNRIPSRDLDEFSKKIFEFKEKLPTSGRINYKFLPPELKKELEDIIKELVFSNDDFSREFEKYVDCARTLSSYYSKNEVSLEKAKKRAEKELLKRLSNKLLNNIKKLDTDRYNANKTKAFIRHETMNIIRDLFSFLSRSAEFEQAKLNNKSGELSKQAKKELIIKKESASSIDWER